MKGDSEKNCLSMDTREYITPSELWNHFRTKLPQAEKPRYYIKGIFKGLNSRKSYNGSYYGRLVDCNNHSVSVTIKIPESLVSIFLKREKALFKIAGSPYWDIRPVNSKAEIVVEVAEVEDIEHEQTAGEDRETAIIKKRLEKDSRDIDSLLYLKLRRREKPRIKIITGETSIVDTDFERAIGEGIRYYQIEIERANLSNAEEIMKALKKSDNGDWDIIALMRGGGSGLEVFNNPELAEFCLELKTPFVTALGHAENKHLLDIVADKCFTTPTNFGNFLKEITSELATNEKLIKEIEEVKEKLSKSEKKLEKLKGREKVYLVVIAALVFILIAILSH